MDARPEGGAPDGRAPDGSGAADGGTRDGGDAPDGALPSGDAGDAGRDGGRAPRRFAPDVSFDYQLGGAYPPPAGVELLVRDRKDRPAPGRYNVCYVNGFQTQPDERDFWTREHPDLVLRDEGGQPVVDPDWDEWLLDVTTAAKRRRLATIVGDWIARCADDGFDAVEIDNLDSYSRSGGRISEDDAVAFLALLSARAHAVGLAIAQKNAAELLPRRDEMGTDFAVVEECNRYDECDAFARAYADRILVVEYRRRDFDRGCRRYPGLSIVLRDRDLRTPDQPGYVYDGC